MTKIPIPSRAIIAILSGLLVLGPMRLRAEVDERPLYKSQYIASGQNDV